MKDIWSSFCHPTMSLWSFWVINLPCTADKMPQGALKFIINIPICGTNSHSSSKAILPHYHQLYKWPHMSNHVWWVSHTAASDMAKLTKPWRAEPGGPCQDLLLAQKHACWNGLYCLCGCGCGCYALLYSQSWILLLFCIVKGKIREYSVNHFHTSIMWSGATWKHIRVCLLAQGNVEVNN